ncbi:FimV family protein [Vreelandella aquamarina]
MKRSFILALLAVWGGASPLAMALNIGDPTVDSFLDAPLQATVPLTGAEGYGVDVIRARLAEPSAFRALGLDWSASTQSVSVTLQNGSPPYLRLTSSAPVREPWLDLLITLESPDGRQTRAITLLLDPPGGSDNASPTNTVSSSTAARAPVNLPERSVPPPQVSPVSGSPANYVASGDTLWSVAERLKPAQASVQQMMLALFEANSNLFPSGNINEMRAGYRLQVPEDSQVFSRTSEAAADAVGQMNRGGSESVRMAPETPSETAASEAAQDVDAPHTVSANNAPSGDDLSTMISATAIEAARTLDSRLRDAQLVEQQIQLDELVQERAERQAEIADLRRQVEELTDALSASQATEDRQMAVEGTEATSGAGQNSPSTNGTASVDSEIGAVAKAASWTRGVYEQAVRDSRLLLAAGAILLLLLLMVMIRRRHAREWQTVEQHTASYHAEPPPTPNAADAAVVAQAAPSPSPEDTAQSAPSASATANANADQPVSFNAREETLDVDDDDIKADENDIHKVADGTEIVGDATVDDLQVNDLQVSDLEKEDLETDGLKTDSPDTDDLKMARSEADADEWPTLVDDKNSDTPYWAEDEEADLGRSQAAGLAAKRNAAPAVVLQDDENPSGEPLELSEMDNERSHFIDYQPPSLSEEPKASREATPMQPTVEFPASGEAASQASDSGSSERERRRTDQENEEDSPLGEGWEIEEVAFHRSGRDNTRSS